jgi:transposase
MPNKKYIVKLTDEERKKLEKMVSAGKWSAKKILRTRVLLKADEGWLDEKIAEALDVNVRTIERIRKQLVEEGFDSVFKGRTSTRQYLRKLDGKQEAQLTTIACSAPPEGRSRWTLHMLADQMVELEYVDAISYQTVNRVLKKTN